VSSCVRVLCGQCCRIVELHDNAMLPYEQLTPCSHLCSILDEDVFILHLGISKKCNLYVTMYIGLYKLPNFFQSGYEHFTFQNAFETEFFHILLTMVWYCQHHFCGLAALVRGCWCLVVTFILTSWWKRVLTSHYCMPYCKGEGSLEALAGLFFFLLLHLESTLHLIETNTS
jgi:hypothetical protein